MPAVGREVVAGRRAINQPDAFLLLGTQCKQVNVNDGWLRPGYGNDRAVVVVNGWNVRRLTASAPRGTSPSTSRE